MSVSEIAASMIEYSNGNRHDINHFMKVYAYAKIIGEREGLDEASQTILEVAAIVHDIACPLCREKYGCTNGKYQEAEGPALVREFLHGSGLPPSAIDRISYLVGRHHTLQNIDGPDCQILIEADYLVNADENQYSRENMEQTLERVFRTKSGTSILKAMYLAD